MGFDTLIPWCHHTHNPWIGCTEVSPGCAHCYARDNYGVRFGIQWGDKGTRRRKAESGLREPLAWNRAAERAGERRRVFCGSLCDVMEDRPELGPWRDQLFQTILFTPWLDWLLLTKRPQNFRRFLPKGWLESPRPNVWLGTTCEDQQRANERIPHLLAVPAVVRFLSCEPLLEDIRFDRIARREVFGPLPEHDWTFYDNCLTGFKAHKQGGWTDQKWRLDWVIVGGESGTNARPFNVEWARSIRDQCKAAAVACFVKQMGAFPYQGKDLPADWSPKHGIDPAKLLHLKHPKGADQSEWPEDLRAREFPTVEKP